MSAPAYTVDNPRYEAAKKFGAQLKRALARKKLRPHHVWKAMGGGYSNFTFHSWLNGDSLPRLDRAIRLANLLDAPALADIVREARTGTCQRRGCGRTFISEGGAVRKYCGARCRQLAHEYDLRFTHAARKKVAGDALQELRERHEAGALAEELGEHRRAVAAFCDGCEPEGYCRQADCALRLVSPLPLHRGFVLSRDVETRQSPEYHERMRQASADRRERLKAEAGAVA